MKILLIDDDITVCESLTLLLRRRGYVVDAIHRPQEAMEKVSSFDPGLILLDMNFTIGTSGQQGLRLLRQIREFAPKVSVILMTGWATVQLAVEGMKLGAKDFIAKPWDNKDLVASVKTIEDLHHKTGPNTPADSKVDSTPIIGTSPEIQQVMDLVERVARTEASVLISGESGTGKELIAEAIHQKSLRQNGPFVKVNLGGIPNDLFESEMFGHKKGAFTGAQQDRAGRFSTADGGTIFLDEIGELSASGQVKMLRVLQEKTFEPLGSSQSLRTDVRVISATNRDLKAMALEGTFREDLYYRINLLQIQLPGLAERRSDIPALAQFFIQNVAALYQSDSPRLSAETLSWLSNQEYRGNIRQLKNVVERTYLLHLGQKELQRKHFLPAFSFDSPGRISASELNLEKLEVDTIKRALARHDYSISAAAKALGITRSSLYRRLEKYGIPNEPEI